MIQLLPGADESVIERIEQGIKDVGYVTNVLKEGISPQELLKRVLRGFDMEILETVPVEYRCYCNRERMKTALISMGREELAALLEEEGRAEMTCQFCDAVHTFERPELEELLASL